MPTAVKSAPTEDMPPRRPRQPFENASGPGDFLDHSSYSDIRSLSIQRSLIFDCSKGEIFSGLPGDLAGPTTLRKVITMCGGHYARGTHLQWVEIIVLVAALLVAGTAPGYARRGTGGFRGGHQRFGHPRVFIAPRLVVPFGPYWDPYWTPYDYLPLYELPAPPPVVIPDTPPPSWYYCDNPKGYYPYVQQCPGGWSQVAPRPS